MANISILQENTHVALSETIWRQWYNVSTMVGRRGTWAEMWDSGTLVTQIFGTFEFVGFMAFWVILVHLSQNVLYLGNGRHREK